MAPNSNYNKEKLLKDIEALKDSFFLAYSQAASFEDLWANNQKKSPVATYMKTIDSLAYMPANSSQSEFKSLNSFFEGLVNMPPEDAKKELDSFNKSITDKETVLCGIMEGTDKLIYLNKDKSFTSSFERIYKGDQISTSIKPKELGFWRKLWNSICMTIFKEPSAAQKEYDLQLNEYNKLNESNRGIGLHADHNKENNINSYVADKMLDFYKSKGVDVSHITNEKPRINQEVTKINDGILERQGGETQNWNEMTRQNRFENVFGSNPVITTVNQNGFTVNQALYKNSPVIANDELNPYARLLCTLAVNSDPSYNSVSSKKMNEKYKLPKVLTEAGNATKSAFTVDVLIDEFLNGKNSAETTEFAGLMLEDGKELARTVAKDKAALGKAVFTGMVNLAASLSTTGSNQALGHDDNITFKADCIKKGFEILKAEKIDPKTIPGATEKMLEGVKKWAEISQVMDKSANARHNMYIVNKNVDPLEVFKDANLEASVRGVIARSSDLIQYDSEDYKRKVDKISAEILDSNPLFKHADKIVNDMDGNKFYTKQPVSNFMQKALSAEKINELRERLVYPNQLMHVEKFGIEGAKFAMRSYNDNIKSMNDKLRRIDFDKQEKEAYENCKQSYEKMTPEDKEKYEKYLLLNFTSADTEGSIGSYPEYILDHKGYKALQERLKSNGECKFKSELKADVRERKSAEREERLNKEKKNDSIGI